MFRTVVPNFIFDYTRVSFRPHSVRFVTFKGSDMWVLSRKMSFSPFQSIIQPTKKTSTNQTKPKSMPETKKKKKRGTLSLVFLPLSPPPLVRDHVRAPAAAAAPAPGAATALGGGVALYGRPRRQPRPAHARLSALPLL